MNETCRTSCEPSERGGNFREDLMKLATRVGDLKFNLKGIERSMVGEYPEEKYPFKGNNGDEPNIGQLIEITFNNLGVMEDSLERIRKGLWG